MAPNIVAVDVYDTGDWQDNQGWETGDPFIETNPLQNHSWVGFTLNDDAAVRMDFAVERDGFLPIAGIYNSDFGNQATPSDIPEIYGSIYNGISVGVSDGTHRAGVTPATYGPGRTKPEIVAPNSFTSFATPYVTAAAAMLIESAGIDPDAKKQLVLKAILLAAANKSPYIDWDQTPLRPLDDIYGAGELDVYESYFIQQAGKQSPATTVKERGWNIDNLGSGNSHNYNIWVPNGFKLRNLSALITWNLPVSVALERVRGNLVNVYNAGSLANMSLSLSQQPSGVSQTSDSLVDNIEHIWLDTSAELSSGNYTLTVTTNSSTTYAIAWRSELYQDYSLWKTTAFTTTPIADQDSEDDPEKDGIPNLLEQAFGGNPEIEDLSILPTSETVTEGNSQYLQISFRKPTHENGLSYTVETVTELDDIWSSQEADVTLQAIETLPDNFDLYTYRRVAPLDNHEKAFLRVSIAD